MSHCIVAATRMPSHRKHLVQSTSGWSRMAGIFALEVLTAIYGGSTRTGARVETPGGTSSHDGPPWWFDGQHRSRRLRCNAGGLAGRPRQLCWCHPVEDRGCGALDAGDIASVARECRHDDRSTSLRTVGVRGAVGYFGAYRSMTSGCTVNSECAGLGRVRPRYGHATWAGRGTLAHFSRGAEWRTNG